MVGKKILVIAIIASLLVNPVLAIDVIKGSAQVKTVDTNTNPYLTTEEIIHLSENSKPGTEFEARYANLFNTAIVRNNLSGGALKIDEKTSRKYFRVMHWNLNRGFGIDTLAKAYKNPDTFLSNEVVEDISKKDLEKLKEDIRILKDTDVFLLNEVDIGMPRTQYRNIVEEFAHMVGANYAFGLEFIEADPVTLADPSLDRSRYKGLHGNAIVSKFPIKNARLIRLPDYYDWYDGESQRVTWVEKIRRKSAKVVFDETIATELRHGSRVALLADLVMPNNEIVTVVSTHIENRTMPRFRERQVKALLEAIKDIPNPIVLGADFNNFENSGEPTSATKVVVRTVGDPQIVGRAVASSFTPYGFIISPALFLTSFARKYRNPTVYSIPVVLRNRNYKLFDIVHDYEFSDKLKFDFEGNKDYTFNGKDGRLANSNERSKFKGFISTYRFKRDLALAIFKIDWLFVKPGINASNPECADMKISKLYEDYSCKKYFPAFPKTLKYLNRKAKDGLISDHNPVSAAIML